MRRAVGSFVGLLLSQTYGGVLPVERLITPSRRMPPRALAHQRNRRYDRIQNNHHS